MAVPVLEPIIVSGRFRRHKPLGKARLFQKLDLEPGGGHNVHGESAGPSFGDRPLQNALAGGAVEDGLMAGTFS